MTDDLPVKVDVGLSAKIEAKTEIPSEVSGRAVNALVDAVSPFTELLGLAGDQIRAIRRWRAVERLEKAKLKLLESERPVQAVPDNFLIPWIENTSKDADEDGLSDIWVNLLTSASSDYSRRMKCFPEILSELTVEDVKFLDSICVDAVYDDRQITFAVNGHLTIMQQALGPINSPQIDGARLKAALDSKNGSFFAAKSLEVNGGPTGAIYTNAAMYDEIGSGLSVLEKNGLTISFTEIVRASHIRLDITYVRITRLGFEFVQAARGVQ